MLNIQNLKVKAGNKLILHGVSLNIKPGEIHVVMGPNGSGKSTLANSIMGHPSYTVSDGKIMMNGKNLTSLTADKRAKNGLFLAFQYPKEIPGVSVAAFLKTAIDSVRKARGLPSLAHIEFRQLLRDTLEMLGFDAKFMNRAINEGFSGGEKKKMEILQMMLLEPRIAILDETDSGLDVDALKTVAHGINKFMLKKRVKMKPNILIITHYQRILRYIKPNKVHVMIDGRIVKSGGPSLGKKLEKEGFKKLIKIIPTS